jgi:acetoin utilization deacetylase AcuC-like enzyme
MSGTGLFYSDQFIFHDTGPNHPERPARMPAIRDRLTASGLRDRMESIEFEPIDVGLVTGVHSPSYIERFAKQCFTGGFTLDSADCVMCPETYDVARLAVGAGVTAVEAAMAGKIRNAFCPVRPPGHHAERDRAMGFCYFNNIALAAERLITHHGIERIAILDFDVHHGNGTQHQFDPDPCVLFCSIHQHPATLFPGTGHAEERGIGPGDGTTLNVPMTPGAGSDDYREAFDELIWPAIDAFQPQFLLFSAGFDAHRLDSISMIRLETDDFGWITREALALAEKHCEGRAVSFLEGGYHLDALADSVQAHVEALLASS